MNIPDSECPVPIDQQPLNEYISLTNSIFFFWTTKPTNFYIIDLLNTHHHSYRIEEIYSNKFYRLIIEI